MSMRKYRVHTLHWSLPLALLIALPFSAVAQISGPICSNSPAAELFARMKANPSQVRMIPRHEFSFERPRVGDKVSRYRDGRQLTFAPVPGQQYPLCRIKAVFNDRPETRQYDFSIDDLAAVMVKGVTTYKMDYDNFQWGWEKPKDQYVAVIVSLGATQLDNFYCQMDQHATVRDFLDLLKKTPFELHGFTISAPQACGALTPISNLSYGDTQAIPALRHELNPAPRATILEMPNAPADAIAQGAQ